MVQKEEVIYTGFDEGWDRELPVRLIFYDNGNIDVHRQTGSHHVEHMKIAQQILRRRGLTVDLAQEPSIGSTGAYYTVTKTPPIQGFLVGSLVEGGAGEVAACS